MGRVSRRKIDPEVEERVFEVFRNYLAALHDPQEVQTFLVSLLTITEQNMLAKRLAIAVLLKRGYTYEHIDHVLKVSMSTVGMVHRQLLSGALGYKKAVEKITREEKNEQLWIKFEELVLALSFPKQHGSFSWRRKSEKGKQLFKRKKKLNSL